MSNPGFLFFIYMCIPFSYCIFLMCKENNLHIEACKRANRLEMEIWKLEEELDKINKKYNYLKNKKG